MNTPGDGLGILLFRKTQPNRPQVGGTVVFCDLGKRDVVDQTRGAQLCSGYQARRLNRS